MTDGAILLAGGRARRVDGAAKHLFDLDGSTLLARARHAVTACVPVTVVGDPVAGIEDVSWVREEPRFGGPAAAVVAGLRSWSRDPEWTYLLACDLPGVGEAVARLTAVRPLLPADTDGACLADASSRPQWLIGLYRTAAIRRASRALPEAGRDAAMRTLFADLAIAAIAAPPDETDDIDTWDDLQRARARIEEDA